MHWRSRFRPELRTALVSFVGSLCLETSVLLFFLRVFSFPDLLLSLAFTAVPILIFSVLYSRIWQISVQASGLGCGMAFGVHLWLWRPFPSFSLFGCYLTVMAAFHFGEYVTTAVTNPRSLKVDSFLLNHSKEYWMAATACWLEYSLEVYFMASMKNELVSSVGVLLCVVGEMLRKGAMLTARCNFTHMISTSKRPNHELVTHGVYCLFRHPAYVGWFWWSIGTQVILCNPVCCVCFCVISWRFFKERIYEEEIYLINFFGVDYVHYQQSVPVGLPFIQGFKPDVA